MNQELIDRIQQDAVTIQRLTAELDSLKQEQVSNARDYKEKLQAEELRYSRLLSETTDKLLGCGHRIDGLESQLGKVREFARKCGWTEDRSLADFVSSQAAEIAKHREDAEQTSKSLGSSISLANSRALEIEALKHDVAREHERGNRINSEYEASIANIMAAANKLGRADYEAPETFMMRQAAEIVGLQAALKNEELACLYKSASKIGRLSGETIDHFMKRQAEEIAGLRKRMDAVIVDKTPSESLKYLYDCADKLGRGTTETLADFMKRQDAAIDSQTNRTSEIIAQRDLERQELQDKAQQLLKVQGWHEENLQKIKELEAEPYMAFMKAELKTAREESARARAETHQLQGGLKIVHSVCGQYGMKEGELLHDFIARIGSDLGSARTMADDKETIELATVTADRDRIRAELAAILAEANKSGRCNGDPVQLLKAGQSDLDARLSSEREADDIKKRWRALNEHAVLKGMRGDETTAEFITRQHRLAADRQTALDRASETIATLTSDLTSAIADKALSGNGAKEINRLSALVAELQVELDDARGKYGGIMAQLGNETPLQLIERMQRLAQDRRASTIPHDERAMLVAESADLRKRLEESQKAHAKAEHELTDARNGANECGMQAGERLRAFIYRKRAELLDAQHASDRIQLLANENVDKLRAALATVENQRAAIAEAKQATEKYTAVVEAAAKLKDWASTIRHKVLVAMVHTKAMAEYDNIMKELDGGKVPQ